MFEVYNVGDLNYILFADMNDHDNNGVASIFLDFILIVKSQLLG